MPVYAPIIRLTRTIFVAILVGILVGVGQVYAEQLTNRYINGLGNVGTVETCGWNNGVHNAWGKSTSNSASTLYIVRAHIRVWHYGVIDNEHNAQCSNCKTKTTNTISYAVVEYAATRSYFQFLSGMSGNNYYTSYGAGSCFNY